MDYLALILGLVVGFLVGGICANAAWTSKVESVRLEAYKDAYNAASSESLEREAQIMLDMKEDIWDKTEAQRKGYSKDLDAMAEQIAAKDARIDSLESYTKQLEAVKKELSEKLNNYSTWTVAAVEEMKDE